jgi:alpha-beta hydrolase superfamily lysophospholipase
LNLSIAAAGFLLATLASIPALAQTKALVTEEMMVKTSDPGIEIYVRNKRPADMTSFRPEQTVLYVHGATYPSETAFDLKLDGVSWMEYIASRGYDVWLLDLRGYGKSTRPPEMADKPEGQCADRDWPDRGQGHRHRGRFHPATPQYSAPQPAGLVVGHDADGDVHHAKRIEGRTSCPLRTGLDPPDAFAGSGRLRKLGAYRTVNRDQSKSAGTPACPRTRKPRSFPPAGSTPGRCDIRNRFGRREMNPPVLRAPNGVVQDSAEFFGAGKPYYDPAKITVPTLLVHAEWDRDTPPYMAQTLFPLLVNSPGKRYVALAEGTHSIIMERNRLQLFEAVQAFLDEAKRS